MHFLDYYRSEEQKEELAGILDYASQQHPLGLGAAFLEKDIWVTELLRLLFDEDLLSGTTVAFKGGTALSKRWQAIERFSEDIDLSIHWSDLTGDERSELEQWEQTTSSKSQAKKFRDQQQQRLEAWTHAFAERLNNRLSQLDISGIHAEVVAGSRGEKIEVSYPSVTASDNQYHLDHVLLEFGGRNRGKPTEPSRLSTYLAEIPGMETLELPVAECVRVFDPGYIIWEKLTALHQFCTTERKVSAARLARHWYDVDCILQKKIVDPLAHLQAMKDVIEMKAARWAEKGVDFHAAGNGALKLVPEEPLLTQISNDQASMISGLMYFTVPDDFSQILERLKEVERSINHALINSGTLL